MYLINLYKQGFNCKKTQRKVSTGHTPCQCVYVVPTRKQNVDASINSCFRPGPRSHLCYKTLNPPFLEVRLIIFCEFQKGPRYKTESSRHINEQEEGK